MICAICGQKNASRPAPLAHLPHPMSNPPLRHSAVFWSVIFTLLLLIASIIVPSISRVQEVARRTVDASSLRQISQASIIYAQSRDDSLPEAADIWDYARALAEDGGADEPSLWWSKSDPASDNFIDSPATVLLPNSHRPRPLDPAFRALKPSVAIPVGKLNTRMPATTPIAWTRGLQPDGTWSPDSPYGTEGGYIAFLGGNVSFYKNLGSPSDRTSALTRFDGQGQTANILEALPPGTRIVSYLPTREETAAWSQATHATQKQHRVGNYILIVYLTSLWLPFGIISISRLIKKRPGAFTVLLWPVFFILMLILFHPLC